MLNIRTGDKDQKHRECKQAEFTDFFLLNGLSSGGRLTKISM